MMRPHIESRYDQFIKDLEAVVNTDSGSECVAGLKTVLAFFEERFSRLGWHTTLHPFAGGRSPGLEITNKKTPGQDDRFDFIMLGHVDTVFPEGTAGKRPFAIQGQRAHGPGVCDMKGGLVTMLHVAEVLQDTGIADGLSLCIAFNSDEETGSKASRPWFEALAARSRRVLVFEPWRATGHRVLQRKGVGDFDILCYGRAAHAGAEPEKGANAVVELAHQILAATSFSRLDLGTTVNVTTVSGGMAENVIPDYAKASVDVRFSSAAEARRIEACFQNLPKTMHVEGVRVDVQGEINRMPMVPSEATLRLWDQLAAIGQKLGLEMKWVSTGGASDGNFTSALGIATIDAMGPRGGSAHSKDEYIELDSIIPNLHLICEFLKSAADSKFF